MSPCLRNLAVACLALLAWLPGVCAQEDEDDIPVVGRPADLPFSGASGEFQVSARAEPTTLRVEDLLTFTLTVQARGQVRLSPQRLDLSQVPAVVERFHLEPAREGDDRRPGPAAWEFVYRLRPRRADVAAVPGVPFVFYNPAIRNPRLAFQTRYTDPIPLQIGRREAVKVALRAPAATLELTTGPALLERQEKWSWPGLLTLVALALVPPLACCGWVLAWRRLYPDDARLARIRRSRAANAALALLREAQRLPALPQAETVVRTLSRYLGDRLDLRVAEPTAEEAASHLSRIGYPAPLAEDSARLLAACAAARFQPGAAVNPRLPDLARRLVLNLEAETWARQSS